MEAAAVEHAFTLLARQPEHVQVVLRPVLLHAIQDPATMRALGEHSLLSHLQAVWEIMEFVYVHPGRQELPALPKDVRIFEHRAIGTHLEDAEEAFNYVQATPDEERPRLSTGLAVALNILKGREEPLSLLALAQLLRFAFQDHTFVEHVFAGGCVEEFLPPSAPQRFVHRNDIHMVDPRPPHLDSDRDGPMQRAAAEHTVRQTAKPTISFFLGKRIQLLIRTEPQYPMMVVEGVCAEITPTYILIVLVGNQVASHHDPGDVLLFGMNAVVRMSVLPASTRA